MPDAAPTCQTCGFPPAHQLHDRSRWPGRLSTNHPYHPFVAPAPVAASPAPVIANCACNVVGPYGAPMVCPVHTATPTSTACATCADTGAVPCGCPACLTVHPCDCAAGRGLRARIAGAWANDAPMDETR